MPTVRVPPFFGGPAVLVAVLPFELAPHAASSPPVPAMNAPATPTRRMSRREGPDAVVLFRFDMWSPRVQVLRRRSGGEAGGINVRLQHGPDVQREFFKRRQPGTPV